MVRCESMSVHIPLHAYSSLQINLSSNLWQVTVCLLTFITYQWRSSGSNSTTYLMKDANWSKGEYWLELVGSMCGSIDRVLWNRIHGSIPVGRSLQPKLKPALCMIAPLHFQMQTGAVESTLSLRWDVKWRSRVQEKHTLCMLKN